MSGKLYSGPGLCALLDTEEERSCDGAGLNIRLCVA